MTTSISKLSDLQEALLEKALEAGFDRAAITTPEQSPEISGQLTAFIESGYHGDMDWIETKRERRAHPSALWPAVKSILVLGMNYGPDGDPLENLEHGDRANISVYARHRDYHDVIKKRLKRVARWLSEEHGAQVKVFVDTAPVAEKPLAQAAGLGWLGKHTNLVSTDYGSWLFLGSIFTDIAFAPAESETNHCGTCQSCLDICPTKAFPAPYRLDARRCISYLTIEHKGHIAEEFRAAMGNRIYGCDDCLAVCPWNKYASTAGETAFHARDDLRAPLLTELAGLDDAAFRKLFSGSPVKRVGRSRFIRNVLIAIGNSGVETVPDIVVELLRDGSPLVRAMAVWALGRLLPRMALELRPQHLEQEPDLAVLAEWEALAR